MKHPRVTWTIGNDGYRQLSGPGSSYYTSRCTNCGNYASSTYQWDRSSLCFECYEVEVLRSARSRGIQVTSGSSDWHWENFFLTVGFGLALTAALILLVWWVIAMVSG